MTARRMTVSPNSAESDGTWQHGRVPPLFYIAKCPHCQNVRSDTEIILSPLSSALSLFLSGLQTLPWSLDNKRGWRLGALAKILLEIKQIILRYFQASLIFSCDLKQIEGELAYHWMPHFVSQAVMKLTWQMLNGIGRNHWMFFT